MTFREWLRANKYNDVADLIDEVMAIQKKSGSGERRGWGLILCGGKDGAPAVVAGKTFPVLASAQRAYGKPVTPNAIPKRDAQEEFPGPRTTGRWETKKLPKRAKRLAGKSNPKPPRHLNAS